MVCTLNIATETKQDYVKMPYNSAVAIKAYSIQALEVPTFNQLLILLGIFIWNSCFLGY